MVLFDNERVLLSRLLSPTGPFSTFPHPLLHYICIGAAILGIILATAGIVGCWASCVHNYCILSVVSHFVQYFKFLYITGNLKSHRDFGYL